MAKTKQDYIDAGKLAYKAMQANDTMREGNPCKPGSWQHAAWQAGFEEAADEAAVPKIEVAEAMAEGNFVMERVEPVKTVNPRWLPPNSVILHMNHLNRKIATCEDDAARARYQRSHARVLKRWVKKIEHAPGALR